MQKRTFLTALFLLVVSFSFLSIYKNAKAQFQDFNFSANDPSCSSYQCTDNSITPVWNTTKEYCECTYTSGTEKALLKPPKLQQIEVWFVRVIYVVWAGIGSLSFVMLVYLGYQYTISKGDVTKITTIRKRILNFCIGLILVFTALPILTTFFRVLGVNGDVKCYQFDTLPRFQFFFPELCTDPKSILVSNPCDFTTTDASGFACPTEGQSNSCTVVLGGGQSVEYTYECRENVWVRFSTF